MPVDNKVQIAKVLKDREELYSQYLQANSSIKKALESIAKKSVSLQERQQANLTMSMATQSLKILKRKLVQQGKSIKKIPDLKDTLGIETDEEMSELLSDISDSQKRFQKEISDYIDILQHSRNHSEKIVQDMMNLDGSGFKPVTTDEQRQKVEEALQGKIGEEESYDLAGKIKNTSSKTKRARMSYSKVTKGLYETLKQKAGLASDTVQLNTDPAISKEEQIDSVREYLESKSLEKHRWNNIKTLVNEAINLMKKEREGSPSDSDKELANQFLGAAVNNLNSLRKDMHSLAVQRAKIPNLDQIFTKNSNDEILGKLDEIGATEKQFMQQVDATENIISMCLNNRLGHTVHDDAVDIVSEVESSMHDLTRAASKGISSTVSKKFELPLKKLNRTSSSKSKQQLITDPGISKEEQIQSVENHINAKADFKDQLDTVRTLMGQVFESMSVQGIKSNDEIENNHKVIVAAMTALRGLSRRVTSLNKTRHSIPNLKDISGVSSDEGMISILNDTDSVENSIKNAIDGTIEILEGLYANEEFNGGPESSYVANKVERDTKRESLTAMLSDSIHLMNTCTQKSVRKSRKVNRGTDKYYKKETKVSKSELNTNAQASLEEQVQSARDYLNTKPSIDESLGMVKTKINRFMELVSGTEEEKEQAKEYLPSTISSLLMLKQKINLQSTARADIINLKDLLGVDTDEEMDKTLDGLDDMDKQTKYFIDSAIKVIKMIDQSEGFDMVNAASANKFISETINSIKKVNRKSRFIKRQSSSLVKSTEPEDGLDVDMHTQAYMKEKDAVDAQWDIFKGVSDLAVKAMQESKNEPRKIIETYEKIQNAITVLENLNSQIDSLKTERDNIPGLDKLAAEDEGVGKTITEAIESETKAKEAIDAALIALNVASGEESFGEDIANSLRGLINQVKSAKDSVLLRNNRIKPIIAKAVSSVPSIKSSPASAPDPIIEAPDIDMQSVEVVASDTTNMPESKSQAQSIKEVAADIPKPESDGDTLDEIVDGTVLYIDMTNHIQDKWKPTVELAVKARAIIKEALEDPAKTMEAKDSLGAAIQELEKLYKNISAKSNARIKIPDFDKRAGSKVAKVIKDSEELELDVVGTLLDTMKKLSKQETLTKDNVKPFAKSLTELNSIKRAIDRNNRKSLGFIAKLEEIADEQRLQKTEAVIEEAETVVEEPEAVVEEPEAVVEEPEAVVEELEAVVEEPETVVEEPEATVEKPMTKISSRFQLPGESFSSVSKSDSRKKAKVESVYTKGIVKDKFDQLTSKAGECLNEMKSYSGASSAYKKRFVNSHIESTIDSLKALKESIERFRAIERSNDILKDEDVDHKFIDKYIDSSNAMLATIERSIEGFTQMLGEKKITDEHVNATQTYISEVDECREKVIECVQEIQNQTDPAYKEKMAQGLKTQKDNDHGMVVEEGVPEPKPVEPEFKGKNTNRI